MIGRQCKGCGIGFEVPEAPARGSSREWCTEACNRRTQRDRRTLELAAKLEAAMHADLDATIVGDNPPVSGHRALRAGIASALDMLGPETARARERQQVKVERLTGANKASRARKPRARKGAPRTT